MLSRPGPRLTDDHAALDQTLKRLWKALDSADPRVIWETLDLFWARLAVHIRAEHLHLFPAVMQAVRGCDGRAAPSADEIQAVIKRLREDHDFFMHELAPAVGIARELVNSTDNNPAASLSTLRNTVLKVEERLALHNDLEEKQIYCLLDSFLKADTADLGERIEAELRPPRALDAIDVEMRGNEIWAVGRIAAVDSHES